MQNQQQSIIKTTSQQLTRQFRRLLALDDDLPTKRYQTQLLHAQPLAQRRQFLSRAVREGATVSLQLLPMTHAGYPVTVTGWLTPITADRFKVITGNVTYVVTFQQINYIAKIKLP